MATNPNDFIDPEFAKLIEQCDAVDSATEKLTVEERKKLICGNLGLPADASDADLQKAIEAGLALYTWLSARNGLDKQAIITFDAKEFRPDGRGELDLNDVKLLDRDKVDAACPRLGEVQERTDLAAEVVRRSRGGLRNSAPLCTPISRGRLKILMIPTSAPKSRT